MNFNLIQKELNYSYSRSSGPGGQNVNKVNTRVELCFDVLNSGGLNESEKNNIIYALKNRLISGRFLVLTSQTTRSQLKNKTLAEKRLFSLLSKAIVPKKKRIATKPNKKSKEQRLKSKRIKSDVKRLRQKPDF